MDQVWFEMRDVRRRHYVDAVWIPLRANVVNETGQYGQEGWQSDYFGVGGLAIPVDQRPDDDELGWTDIGQIHHRPDARSDSYTTGDVYERMPGEPVGVALVLCQSFDGSAPDAWHLNQDLVLGLELLQEGDVWVRPDEGFDPVVRMTRSSAGNPVLIEIRSEFLRDYLAARRMAFRLTMFRERDEIAKDVDHIKWPPDGLQESGPDELFEGRIMAIHPGGREFGSEVGYFHMGRSDVDPEVDVPTFHPGEGEIEGSSGVLKQSGPKLHRIIGELWRNEWIEPALASPRVRGDRMPTEVSFIIDAAGNRLSADQLTGLPGRYLWFRSAVIPDLLSRRGSKLIWYTGETGGVSVPPSTPIHFGVNQSGLVTVYAKDVAELREWQRRIWAGFNVSPEGGVSTELLSAQQRAVPADSQAPEVGFRRGLRELDAVFTHRWGASIFMPHDAAAEIESKIHRFRSLDDAGLLSLAKDVARLTADSFDISVLQRIVPPAKGDKKPGSLKSLEAVLATLVPPDEARRALTKLVGVYDLRLGDAHMPSSRIDDAFALAGIDRSSPPIEQGVALIAAAADALHGIAKIIGGEAPHRAGT